MRIAADGNVGIGTASPGKALEVIASADNDGIEIGSSSGNVRVIDFTRTTTHANPTARIQVTEPGATHTSDMRFFTSDASGSVPNILERMRIKSDGNIGIGTTSPAGRLQVTQVASDQSGAAALKVIGTAYGTNKAIHSYMDTSNATKSLLYVENSSGSVLNITGDGKSTFGGNVSFGDNKKLLLGASDDLEIYHDGSNNYINSVIANGDLILDTAQNFYIKHSGETMIQGVNDGAVNLFYNGTKKFETTSTGVTVTGLLTATTKSFTIDHPTKPGKKLRYGSLEGPENGVYIRGKSNNNTIELPEYWTKLVDKDSITVQLTAIGKPQQLYVERIDNNIVYVQSEENRKNISQLNYYYLINAERIDVDKLQVEIEE